MNRIQKKHGRLKIANGFQAVKRRMRNPFFKPQEHFDKLFADTVQGRSYQFQKLNEYTHPDGHEVFLPHIAMCDLQRRPRFVLAYDMFGKDIYVRYIQRASTTIQEVGSQNREVERRRQAEFQKTLPVRNPEELLFEKLLNDFRPRLGAREDSLKVWLVDPTIRTWEPMKKDVERHYYTLRGHYFGKSQRIKMGISGFPIKAYPLSLEKARVKKFLATMP
ncbi:MAG TPA: hypothetical protein VJH23_01380 [archaeon]|nr:hypothetical protein [archaeon]